MSFLFELEIVLLATGNTSFSLEVLIVGPMYVCVCTPCFIKKEPLIFVRIKQTSRR